MTDAPTDDDFEELRGENIAPERAERFYNRVRTRIQSYVDSKGLRSERRASTCCSFPTSSFCCGASSTTAGSAARTRSSSAAASPITSSPSTSSPRGRRPDRLPRRPRLRRLHPQPGAGGHGRCDPPRALARRRRRPLTIQKVLGKAESLIGTEIVDRIKRMAK